jgi:hypothetical protein
MNWYRVAFRSKAIEEVAGSNVRGYPECIISFYDRTGHRASSEVRLSVQCLDRWQANELRFRAQSPFDEVGRPQSVTMRIEFSAPVGLSFYVDDFVLEETTTAEVAVSADKWYENLPDKLKYQPKATRWQRLSATLERFRRGGKVRIVVLGDQIQQSLANTPIDVFLERHYPACKVEIIPLVVEKKGQSSGVDQTIEGIIRLRPNLLILGGSTSPNSLSELQTVVDRIRGGDALMRRKTDILLLTDMSSPNGVEGNATGFTSDIIELDQEPKNNALIPDDYRGRLLQFAAENNIEFLDLVGILSEFASGAVGAASFSAPGNSDGVPYSVSGRDWTHPSESSKQINARILEIYFAQSIEKKPGLHINRKTKDVVSMRLFDAEGNVEDGETYAVVRREFGASVVERPVLARTFLHREGSIDQKSDGLNGMAFRVGSQRLREIGYVFDEPLDLRRNDVVVYWAFRTDRSAGDEQSRLAMSLCFAEPSVGERAQVSLAVRPGKASMLSVGGELDRVVAVEHEVEVPVENFSDSEKAAKFRLSLRWMGGDRVVAEADAWHPRLNRWEPFVPFDRPGAPPLVLELSVEKNLLGTTTFKALFFEAVSAKPKLEAVLVTLRPSMIR